MAEKFLNLSGLNTLWTKLKSTFAKVVHTHAASDITSGTFGTSRIANAAITTEKVKDGAITPEKINVISLPYQRAANGGRNWHCIFKVILPTDRTTAESRHSKAYRVFDLYIDGYQNQGKYSYLGRLGINFSIATGMTIADYNFLTHGYARAKWVLGRPSESAYDCKIVKTESTIEFFILSNYWDTNLAVVCEKKYNGRFGDGEYDSTIVKNAYTIEEFETYCSDKVVVNSELDDIKIGWAEKADTASSADSATKATQDGSGNNIVDTYATKTELSAEATARSEADESLQENINAEARARVSADNALQESINSKANSSELSSKLNTSGSNASITTTNALLNKGDVISDYTKLSDNDYVITKSSNTNRTSLGSLYAWIISKFESLTGRFLNLQVYQGENGALTNVATDYSLNLNYYTKSAVDTLLAKKANVTALNSLGNRVDDIEEQLATAGTRSPGRCLRPTCVFEANASASIDAIRQNYNTAIYPYDICIIINVSSSSITISGFQTSSGTESYSVPAYKCVMFTALGTNSQYIKTTDKT